MIRWVGMALAFGGCLLLGGRGAWRLHLRETALRQAAEDMEELARRLGWNAPPLPQLLAGLGQGDGPLAPACRHCLAALEQVDRPPFGVVWRQGIALCTDLPPPGIEALEQAGGLLGQYDPAAQQAGLGLLAERLRTLAAQAEEQRQRMSRVYWVAGGAAGLLLVILLA